MSFILPYNLEALLSFLGRYNQEMWPLQIISLMMVAAVLLMMTRPRPAFSRAIGLILVIFLDWSGLVFYGQYFSQMSFLAPFYAIAFVVQGLFLLWLSVVQNKLEFHYRHGPWEWAGISLILAAIALYPLASILLTDPSWQSFAFAGLTPIPTMLFTSGVICLAQPTKKQSIALFTLPVLFLIAVSMSLVILIGM